MMTLDEVPAGRRPEFDAVVELLCSFGVTPAAPAVAQQVALGCMEDFHLWRAMCLGNRAELRELLETNFPAFAAMNDRDMRWKRFIYKKLCGWEGFND